MTQYITACTIKMLREKKKLTQKELADRLSVSDKSVSKWETGRGYPDITLLESLAKALGASVAELLSGDCVTNSNKSANLCKSVLYVCPVCGNVLFGSGAATVSCCGITLPQLEAETAQGIHQLLITRHDGEYHIQAEHPMQKEHYISFIAYLTGNRILLTKLYPQQDAEVVFPISGHGTIYAYCNRDGLYMQNV